MIRKFLLIVPLLLLLGSSSAYPSKRGGKAAPAKPSPLLIMNKGKGTFDQLVALIVTNNNMITVDYVRLLVANYMKESRREGVSHDVAVCQMCLETGFLRFSGSVSRYQNNFCGLGATDPWASGDWFRSMEEGVRAHIQHLKAYASVEPIKPPVVDTRIVYVKRGTAKTVHDLSGRWASDPDYGIKIESILKQLYSKY